MRVEDNNGTDNKTVLICLFNMSQDFKDMKFNEIKVLWKLSWYMLVVWKIKRCFALVYLTEKFVTEWTPVEQLT